MKQLIGTAFMVLALSATAGNAIADEVISESRAVDARVVKVKLGGVIDLRL